MRTYGTIRLHSKGVWLIQCEPHVDTRFKRIFERAAKSTGRGGIAVADTPEICRDLQWFMERYPLKNQNHDYLTRRANDFQRQLELIASIVGGKYTPRAMEMAIPAREYQRIAAELLLSKGALLLGDDVGLGKTVSAFACMTDKNALPAAVVTLTHLPRQWKEMLAEFIPGLRSHIIRTGTPHRIDDQGRAHSVDLAADLLYQRPFPDVVILSYSKLAAWSRVLRDHIKMVVFDECQELRSGEGYSNKPIKKYLGALDLASASNYRLGLSATPIYNFGGEMYNVMDALAPDALGSKHEFNREWCIGSGNKTAIKDPEAFGAYLREQGLLLRRTAKEVGRELPAVETVVHYVQADMEEFAKLQSIATNLAQTILAQQGVTNFQKMEAGGQLDYMMRMATGVSKAPYVAEFVKMLLDSDEKVVLFGWHHDVYKIWSERLEAYKPVFYTGRETTLEKERAKAAFCDGDSRVMIISLRAGMGMNGLQFVSRICVHGELDWSPQVHYQCLDASTEILTRRGFVGVDDILPNDLVAAFDIWNERVEWCPVISRIDRALADDETMYSVESPSVDLRVTGNHRMVYRRKSGNILTDNQIRISPACEIAELSQGFKLPVAAVEYIEPMELTDDEIRLLGWYITDGSFNRAAHQLVFSQSEGSPFNNELRRVIESCGLRYSIWRTPAGTFSQYNRRFDQLQYLIPKFGRDTAPSGHRGYADFEEYFDKDMSPLLERLDRRQLGIYLEAVHQGDGEKHNAADWTQRSYHISIGRRAFADRLQSLCLRRGYAANISERQTERGKPHYTLHIKDIQERDIRGTSHPDRPGLRTTEATAGERVWCVENRLGTLFVRRNGKTAIVGNCRGRLERDGQQAEVLEYYLVCDHGSDPIIVDTLGLKKRQSSGILDPGAPLVSQMKQTGANIKRLAAAYLQQRGHAVPALDKLPDITPAPEAQLGLSMEASA